MVRPESFGCQPNLLGSPHMSMVASGYDTRNRRARRPEAEGPETVPRGADGERRPRVLRGARAGDQGGAHRARTQSTGPRGRRRRLVRVPLRHRDGPRETRLTVVPRDRRGHAPLPQHADARGRALPRADRWRGGTSAAAAAGAGRPASGRDPGEDGPHERGRAVAGSAQVVPRRTDARRGRAGPGGGGDGGTPPGLGEVEGLSAGSREELHRLVDELSPEDAEVVLALVRRLRFGGESS